MKKLLLLLVAVVSISIFSSCGSSPYKKRKGCKGNGSWYGNRNLGAVEQPATAPTYTMIAEEESAAM